jgi:hypothetical protein
MLQHERMTLTAAPTLSATAPPRWAVWAAHGVPLINLPSALWRVALVAGIPLGFDDALRIDGDGYSIGQNTYILSLTVVTELVALLSLGLVQQWGRVWPRWIPGLAGRRVPRLLPLCLAYPGALLMELIWIFATSNALQHSPKGVTVTDTGFTILALCYLPLLAWGPLLAAATYSYQRHTRRQS